MPVVKEWTCNECGTEYERIKPLCPSCSSCNSKRAFRTPPGINGGLSTPNSAKRIDGALQYQFDKLGIDNFRTMEFGRPNKVDWRPYKPAMSGDYSGGGQPAINPTIGSDQLSKLGFNPNGLEQSRDTERGPWTVEFRIPTDTGAAISSGAGVPMGRKPTELYKQTNVIGAIDADSRGTIKRVK